MHTVIHKLLWINTKPQYWQRIAAHPRKVAAPTALRWASTGCRRGAVYTGQDYPAVPLPDNFLQCSVQSQKRSGTMPLHPTWGGSNARWQDPASGRFISPPPAQQQRARRWTGMVVVGPPGFEPGTNGLWVLVQIKQYQNVSLLSRSAIRKKSDQKIL